MTAVPRDEPRQETSLQFVGTATTVLRLGPFTVLTDPNFLHRGQRAYLGRGLWSRRLTEPALGIDDLPPLDAVLLSHLHGDHFDRVARQGLDRTVPLLTTPHAGRRLGRWGFEAVQGLAPWESAQLSSGRSRLVVTSVPGVHAPGPARRLLPPVMGSVLTLETEGRPPFRLYVSGDTLCRPWLREVLDRTGPLDAAVLHLGGTRILGMLVTMDGEQGAELLSMLAPPIAVPVHHDDYGVFKSPLQDFIDAARRRDLGDRVRLAERGQTVDLARLTP